MGAVRARAVVLGSSDDVRIRPRDFTAYDVDHGKRLHLIAVRRDFSGFQHVHPTLDQRVEIGFDAAAERLARVLVNDSGIRSFAVRPQGASFELVDAEEVGHPHPVEGTFVGGCLFSGRAAGRSIAADLG